MLPMTVALLLAAPAADTARPGAGAAGEVQAAGAAPIDVDVGHAAPFVGDFDGDGRPDLLVGQFGDGKLRIYRNAGDAKAPRFDEVRVVQGRRRGRPRPRGLMRRLRSPVGGPRRRRHATSSPAPGRASSTSSRAWARASSQAAETLKDKDGKPINAGSASAAFAVDWRRRRQARPVVGTIEGQVWLVPNEGTPEQAGVRQAGEAAGGRQADPGHPRRLAPVVADWDGDGKPDLVVGAGDGSVLWFRNERHAEGAEAGSAGDAGGRARRAGRRRRRQAGRGARGPRSCVVDWDGDGQLDLLVGDFGMSTGDRPKMTAADELLRKETQEKLQQAGGGTAAFLRGIRQARPRSAGRD